MTIEAPQPHAPPLRGRALFRWSPLTLAGVVFALLLVAILLQSLHLTGGRLVYALDDAYIHMAMAKNLVRHGTWGVTPHEFSSSSSSPLWTLLVSGGFALFGLQAAIPLILNVVAALLVLGVAYVVLRRVDPGADGRVVFGLLLALIVVTPLVPLVMSGQEHLLHLATTLLFVHLAARRIVRPRPPATSAAATWERVGFWVLPPVMMMIRYESGFLLAPVGLLLATRRRWREAVTLAALSLAPVLIFGWLGHAHGDYLLPNPIMRKASFPWRATGEMIKTATGYSAVRRLFVNPHLLFPLLVALVWLAWPSRGRARAEGEGTTMLFIFVVALVLHLSFAEVGWFYRYEAYLLGLGILSLGVVTLERLPALRAAEASGTGATRAG
ncbi:MAG: hypothetical protein V1774_11315, partial [Candidatus Eisenbacteria bacterium]